MSKKNKNKTEEKKEEVKAESVKTEVAEKGEEKAPEAEKEEDRMSLEEASDAVRAALEAVNAEKAVNTNREVSIALFDIGRALTTATRHFSFIGVASKAKDKSSKESR